MDSRTIINAIGTAFAGFCMWLAVRIFNRREKWAKRTAMALVTVPVLYVLSFGPVCRLEASVPINLQGHALFHDQERLGIAARVVDGMVSVLCLAEMLEIDEHVFGQPFVK